MNINIKFITSTFLALVLTSNLVFSSFAQENQSIRFQDVPQSHENYNAILLLSGLGIIKGYPDGTFKPAQPINRVEALKILLESAKVNTETAAAEKSSFKDVADIDWFFKYTQAAKKLTIISGNPDGTFAPGRQVNKAEFVKMMLLAYKTDLSAFQSGSIPFKDLSEGQWYLPYFRYAKKFNIVSPNEKGEVNPGALLSRGEAAEILYRLILVARGGDVQGLLSEAEALLVDALIDMQQKNYSGAQIKVIKAIEKTKEATGKSDQKIVAAAHLVAQALDQNIKAYLYALEKKITEAKDAANKALDLSKQAETASTNVTPITNQIREFVQSILQQIQ